MSNNNSPRAQHSALLGFLVLILLIAALPWLVLGLVKYGQWVWAFID